MGTHSDDFGFAKWALHNGRFKYVTPKLVAEFLVARTDARGLTNVVAHINGRDLLATDIYELLRQADPDAWHDYCAHLEEGDEWQSRLDNAKGKSY